MASCQLKYAESFKTLRQFFFVNIFDQLYANQSLRQYTHSFIYISLETEGAFISRKRIVYAYIVCSNEAETCLGDKILGSHFIL